jgi:hypothetical protein
MKKNLISRKLAKISKPFLSKKNVYITRGVYGHEIKNFAKTLWPVKTEHQLIRIGGSKDGGYLVPNDLSEIKACFSPGVSNLADFEEDLLKMFGIDSHLCDYSVEAPPTNFEPLSFTKKFLGATDNERYMTLENWANSLEGELQKNEYILQMDIEGGEYETILATPVKVLKRFRIMNIEIHDIESWSHPIFFNMVKSFFDKLLANFNILHNHPNNFCGLISLGEFEFPKVMELTFLRKDRCTPNGYCKQFPHPLDEPSVTIHKSKSYEEMTLPKVLRFTK